MSLSVPPLRRRPEREPSPPERAALHAVADALIPPHGELPAPSALPGYDAWLDRALAARATDAEAALAVALRLAAPDDPDLRESLKSFAAAEPDAFHLLSSIVAGAYLMVPEVRAAIGYPGQRPHPPQFDEAALQIMDGILDPVIERGPVYTPAS
jgi:hypothetical protein